MMPHNAQRSLIHKMFGKINALCQQHQLVVTIQHERRTNNILVSNTDIETLIRLRKILIDDLLHEGWQAATSVYSLRRFVMPFGNVVAELYIDRVGVDGNALHILPMITT